MECPNIQTVSMDLKACGRTKEQGRSYDQRIDHITPVEEVIPLNSGLNADWTGVQEVIRGITSQSPRLMLLALRLYLADNT